MKLFSLFACWLSITAASPFRPGDADCCQEYCYSTDPAQPQRYEFASKTAYQWAKAERLNFALEGCRPNKLFMFIRHGTRYPVDDEFEELALLDDVQADFIKNYKDGKAPKTGALCAADQRLLESWKWDDSITIDKADWLTEQGFEDLVGLGQSYRPLIEQLAELRYDPSVYDFRHTDSQRTNASFRGFFEGLFGRGSSVNQPSPPVFNPDMLLRPYDVCDPYQLRREDKEQRQLFEAMDEFQQLIADVSTKLGFSKALKKGRVNSIYDMCVYEQAWHLDKPSPWCSALTYAQNEVMHYREDLKSWYKTGYAYPDNRFLMCSAVKDMVNRIRDTDGPPVSANFAHSTGLYLMINALGWFKDTTPLLASNFRQQANRQWFISKVSPFASNIAVTRYGCDDGVNRIRIFFNERPKDLPWCPRGICTVDDLVKEYEFFLSANCDQIYCR